MIRPTPRASCLDLLLCLPIVGMSLFEKAKVETTSKSGDLILKAKGIEGHGQDTANGFVVRAGSQVLKDEVDSIPSNVKELRQKYRQVEAHLTAVISEDP
jgi:hypothetical protein